MRTMPMPYTSNQIWSILADDETGFLYVGSKIRILELDPTAYYYNRRKIFLSSGVEGSAVSSALCGKFLYFGTANGKILVVDRNAFTLVVSPCIHVCRPCHVNVGSMERRVVREKSIERKEGRKEGRASDLTTLCVENDHPARTWIRFGAQSP